MILLDLNSRQCARALQQALRMQAEVRIEPRIWTAGEQLTGTLAGRDGSVLRIDLSGPLPHAISGLPGAFCDIEMVLSGQMYVFSTCVLDALDAQSPPRLLLALPEAVQVANRRRYLRRAPDRGVPVSIRVDEPGASFVGELANISPDGMACRVQREEVDPVLLVGDTVRLVFEIDEEGPYDLQATVCNKGADEDRTLLLAGFEFDSRDPQTREMVTRIRAALFSAAPGASETDA